jgi:hypothetical protein
MLMKRIIMSYCLVLICFGCNKKDNSKSKESFKTFLNISSIVQNKNKLQLKTAPVKKITKLTVKKSFSKPKTLLTIGNERGKQFKFERIFQNWLGKFFIRHNDILFFHSHKNLIILKRFDFKGKLLENKMVLAFEKDKDENYVGFKVFRIGEHFGVIWKKNKHGCNKSVKAREILVLLDKNLKKLGNNFKINKWLWCKSDDFEVFVRILNNLEFMTFVDYGQLWSGEGKTNPGINGVLTKKFVITKLGLKEVKSKFISHNYGYGNFETIKFGYFLAYGDKLTNIVKFNNMKIEKIQSSKLDYDYNYPNRITRFNSLIFESQYSSNFMRFKYYLKGKSKFQYLIDLKLYKKFKLTNKINILNENDLTKLTKDLKNIDINSTNIIKLSDNTVLVTAGICKSYAKANNSFYGYKYGACKKFYGFIIKRVDFEGKLIGKPVYLKIKKNHLSLIKEVKFLKNGKLLIIWSGGNGYFGIYLE